MSEIQHTLLVIDDDAIVRHSISAYLKDSGYRVAEAVDGESGLAMVNQLQPDVIITDLRMPTFDGLTLLNKVHAQNPELPVIVISGAGLLGDVVEALRLGAVDYLIKPIVDMEVLVHSVNKCIERRFLLAQNRKYREDLEAANRELRDHLRMLEKDQEAGRHVQQSLLPPTPIDKRHYHVEHRVVPSLYLSGDFIDLAYVHDRYLAFYLTDVSGHGASSAFVTVWMKHIGTDQVNNGTFYTDERTAASSPSKFLKNINTLLNNSRLENHMTCLTGVIDTLTHQLTYSVAGHLPLPILLMPGQAPRYLPGKGKPLGLFRDVEWENHHLAFPPGAALVSFSDGILEVLPPSDLLEKEDYLLQILARTDGTLQSISTMLNLDGIEAAPDDIAVLSIVREV